MTLMEMAKSLGLKDTAPLRRLCEAGRLRAEKKGRDWFVPLVEVERYRLENLGKRGRRPKQDISNPEIKTAEHETKA